MTHLKGDFVLVQRADSRWAWWIPGRNVGQRSNTRHGKDSETESEDSLHFLLGAKRCPFWTWPSWPPNVSRHDVVGR